MAFAWPENQELTNDPGDVFALIKSTAKVIHHVRVVGFKAPEFLAEPLIKQCSYLLTYLLALHLSKALIETSPQGNQVVWPFQSRRRH